MRNALGLIEAVGMAAAIEAADAALKSANVTLIGIELTKGDGMVVVKLEGDVGAIQAAVESAKHAASLVNRVYATKVIPRPAEGIEKIVFSKETKGWKAAKAAEAAAEPVVETPAAQTPVPELIEEAAAPRTADEPSGTVTEPAASQPEPEAQPDPSREGVCNYCQDPACPRRKGDPRDWCIHLNE